MSFALGGLLGFLLTGFSLDVGGHDDHVGMAVFLIAIADLFLVIFVVGLLTAMAVLIWGDSLRPTRAPLLWSLAACCLAALLHRFGTPSGSWLVDTASLLLPGPVAAWVLGMLGFDAVLRWTEFPTRLKDDSTGRVSIH